MSIRKRTTDRVETHLARQICSPEVKALMANMKSKRPKPSGGAFGKSKPKEIKK